MCCMPEAENIRWAIVPTFRIALAHASGVGLVVPFEGRESQHLTK
jgi:hypothetical protein